MKSKVVQVYITLIVSAVALATAIILFLCPSFYCKELILNILYGVFGSGILTFIISVIEYSNIKRQAINDFYDECSDFLELIHKVSYMDITELEEATAKYISLKLLFDSDENDRKAFCAKTKKELNNANINVDEDGVIMLLKLESDSFEKRLTESMLSYIDVSKHSIQRLYRFTNSFYFFSPVFNKKHKEYLELYDEVDSLYRAISTKAAYFHGYIKNNVGNAYQMVSFIKELNSKLFGIEQYENGKIAWDEKYHMLSNKLSGFYNLVAKKETQTKEAKPVFESTGNLANSKGEHA